MRLTAVEIEGFKRFQRRTVLKVDGDVTALVGPNEVGKTSALDAIAHMNHEDAFDASELTRGSREPDDAKVVTLSFLIERGDVTPEHGIAEASRLRWYVISKCVDGTFRHRIVPDLQRDISLRLQAIKVVRRAAEHRTLQALWLDPEVDADQDGLLALAEELESADAQSMPVELIEALDHWADVLSEPPDDAPQFIVKLAETLLALARAERAVDPGTAALQVLFKQRPRLLLFEDEDRSLDNYYELSELEDPPAALTNLASLADLDLRELAAAIRDERHGEVQGLRDKANQQLRRYFEDHWRQTGLTVELSVSATNLELYVREASGDYWQLGERSDGLRWFVALVAYLHAHTDDKGAILLIDEAEQHLHYDGQADLVRAFERQEAVQSIIYTTHSAGCLPQDLGTGVRVVARNEETSEIQNSLWSANGSGATTGFSNLLMQMGASTFAFTATRRAIVCEGITDVALLPTLFRQALGIDVLAFQLVPGLANIAGHSILDLDMAAIRVAFLVDSDKAGGEIARKLRRAGIDEKRILRLGTERNRYTLEDLLEPRQLKEAVDAELKKSGIEARVPLSAIRRPGSYTAIERWCRTQTPPIQPPPKLAVAHELLHRGRVGEKIVSASTAKHLTGLYQRMLRVLD